MNLAEQIAQYLHNAGVCVYDANGTTGNTYIDMLPDGSNITAIYNRGGAGSDIKNGYRMPGIQIIYRGTQYPILSSYKADDIFKALNGFSGYFVDGGNYVVSCLSSQGQPECMGTSQQGNFEYTMNFLINYKEV